jgi:hypothetical protein
MAPGVYILGKTIVSSPPSSITGGSYDKGKERYGEKQKDKNEK